MEESVAIKVVDDLRRPNIVARMNGKLVYHARNVEIVEGKDLWPNRTDVDGVRVLVGETFLNGEWVPLRSSSLVNVDTVTGVYETLNSVYLAPDLLGSLSVGPDVFNSDATLKG
ncbi:hypothetical protein Churi_gp339 [Pseudomonas phage Churi]|nr:hypothetical protein Churi01_gp339 [Pseudomonas phage Churi01]WAX23549.1 hypothetical protein [Pseudomonas phage pPA-N1803-4At.2]